MSIVIINWRGGENDPFTYFSACMKQAFERMGRPTHVINLDDSFGQAMAALDGQEIDFVILWQGIGLDIGATDTDPTTFWDRLQVPVLCYHGDHPCHMPGNHKAMSPWVEHIYSTASFAMFANRFLPRKSPASYFPPPVSFTDGVKGRFDGDFFVFPKNVDDVESTLAAWRAAPDRPVARFLLGGADAIIAEFQNGNRNSHHDIIDGMLDAETIAILCDDLENDELVVRVHLHMLLDKIHRNTVSEHVVNELADVPLKVYGRGWERFEGRRNPRHEFLSFDAMSDNSFQYASRYGILDAAPIHDSLHDRTVRAMANGSGFLMGSDWSYETFLGADYGKLFFDGSPGALRARAERVMQSPEEHRALCRDFAQQYKRNFSLFNFTKYFEGMSDMIRTRAGG